MDRDLPFEPNGSHTNEEKNNIVDPEPSPHGIEHEIQSRGWTMTCHSSLMAVRPNCLMR